MEHKETGCQAPPEAPTLCANNCGFFGSAATMNLCSKCHKDLVMKQEQAKLAVSSFGSIMNGSSSGSAQETAAPAIVDVQPPGPTLASVMPKEQPRAEEVPCVFALKEHSDVKVKEGPSRCATCRKRVGLTGFNCRCGNLFCASHRYSDKHDCPFDYRTAGRDAIAKANPVVKADKLDKI